MLINATIDKDPLLTQSSRPNSYSRILKANLSWSPSLAKFFQLIASLSAIQPQLNLT